MITALKWFSGGLWPPFFVLLILSGCVDDDPSEPWISDSTLVVLNSIGETLSLVDLRDFSVFRDAVGTGRVPNAMVRWRDRLFVVNSGGDDITEYQIGDQLTVKGEIELAGVDRHLNPYHLAATDQYLWVSYLLADSVGRIDPVTHEETRYPVGHAPAGILVSGHHLFVANSNYDFAQATYQTGSVTVLDQSSGEWVSTLPAGVNPQKLSVKDNDEILVLCAGRHEQASEIYRYSLIDLSLLGVIQLETDLLDLAFTADNVCWIAAGGWSGGSSDLTGRVYGYDWPDLLDNSESPTPQYAIATHRGAMSLLPLTDTELLVATVGGGRVDLISGTGLLRSLVSGDGPLSLLLLTP